MDAAGDAGAGRWWRWPLAALGGVAFVEAMAGEPALALALPVIALGSAAAGWGAGVDGGAGVGARRVCAALLVALGLGFGLAAVGEGARIRAGQAEARGALIGGPVAGAFPGQRIALVIDGFGPHDLVLRDHVDPSGARGPAPAALAAALEAELHAVAELRYPPWGPGAQRRVPLAEGRPLAAHLAWSGATVRAVPTRAPGQGETFALELRSGGRGPHSRVAGVCPSRPDPAPREEARGTCPQSYAPPGDAGLALRSPWGATSRPGRWSGPLAPPEGLGARVGWWLAATLLLVSLATLCRPPAALRRAVGWAGVVALLLVALAVGATFPLGFGVPPPAGRWAEAVDGIARAFWVRDAGGYAATAAILRATPGLGGGLVALAALWGARAQCRPAGVRSRAAR